MKNRLDKIQNTLKQIKPKKIGAVLTVLSLCAICAIGGYELRSSTDSNSSVLPVGKGGTGGNNKETALNNLLPAHTGENSAQFLGIKNDSTVGWTNHSYSYEEQKTGETWVNNKPIYTKSYPWNNPTSLSGDINTEIPLPENIDAVIDYKIMLWTECSNAWKGYSLVAPAAFGAGGQGTWHMYMGANAPGCFTRNTAIITTKYTKTAN